MRIKIVMHDEIFCFPLKFFIVLKYVGGTNSGSFFLMNFDVISPIYFSYLFLRLLCGPVQLAVYSFHYEILWEFQIANKKEKLSVVISREEIKRLIYGTKNIKHRLVLVFLYYAGMRLNEVRNIRWEDIDFDRELIHIKMTKGEKERVVFLHRNLRKTLEFYGVKTHGLVFLSQKGGRYSPKSIQMIVKHATERERIKKNVTPHTLRHSFATHLLGSGADIRYIQQLLGHKHLKTTQIYTLVANREIKELAKLL